MLEDVIRGEAAEKELDAFITRRALKMNPEQRRIEEAWAESARAHNARRREECLRERLGFHRAMLDAHTRNFEELMRRHRVGLRLCEEALGLPTSEEARGGGVNKRHRERLARLLTQRGSKDPDRFIPPDEREQQERERQERARRERERRGMPFGHGFFR